MTTQLFTAADYFKNLAHTSGHKSLPMESNTTNKMNLSESLIPFRYNVNRLHSSTVLKVFTIPGEDCGRTDDRLRLQL
ncbi:hypothetical protein KIN20_009076 [Parelaphostrongylus tenuis]|uniref:Uncharacterized protein n=1 Tax=Parelaphostrongylus tenuis TaxID=148309 RepID=A0AAD5QL17_PARTN|nr:hypothetical protein KIN20_009076 [Parelaphostrongylus tenuis]